VAALCGGCVRGEWSWHAVGGSGHGNPALGFRRILEDEEERAVRGHVTARRCPPVTPHPSPLFRRARPMLLGFQTLRVPPSTPKVGGDGGALRWQPGVACAATAAHNRDCGGVTSSSARGVICGAGKWGGAGACGGPQVPVGWAPRQRINDGGGGGGSNGGGRHSATHHPQNDQSACRSKPRTAASHPIIGLGLTELTLEAELAVRVTGHSAHATPRRNDTHCGITADLRILATSRSMDGTLLLALRAVSPAGAYTRPVFGLS